MTGGCDSCLRRAHLVAALAPRIAGLLDHPSRPGRALLALEDDELVAAVAGPRTSTTAVLGDFSRERARERLARAEVEPVCLHDSAYPPALRELVDAPPVLFCRGGTGVLDLVREQPTVAVVGSRRPSPYGLEVARSLGHGLATAGVVVVSGLALGIDAAAHRGCVDAGGVPVAVLAGGPDVPYPSSNRRLYTEVVRSGVVLSEMPPGQRAFRWSFPARNRLMAGLAGMTVVVEAADPSGSLITTEFAQDLGRVVGAVPGRVTSRMAAGSNALLRDGAVPIRDAEDVLDEMLGTGARPPSTPTAAAARRRARLPAEVARVLDAVEAGEGVGQIASAAGITARAARVALVRLEADGLIVRGALGSYERAGSA